MARAASIAPAPAEGSAVAGRSSTPSAAPGRRRAARDLILRPDPAAPVLVLRGLRLDGGRASAFIDDGSGAQGWLAAGEGRGDWHVRGGRRGPGLGGPARATLRGRVPRPPGDPAPRPRSRMPRPPEAVIDHPAMRSSMADSACDRRRRISGGGGAGRPRRARRTARGRAGRRRPPRPRRRARPSRSARGRERRAGGLNTVFVMPAPMMPATIPAPAKAAICSRSDRSSVTISSKPWSRRIGARSARLLRRRGQRSARFTNRRRPGARRRGADRALPEIPQVGQGLGVLDERVLGARVT